MWIDDGRRHPSAVLCRKHGEGEWSIEDQWRLVPEAVDGWHEGERFGDRVIRIKQTKCPLLLHDDRDGGIDVVDRFAQIDRRILARSRALLPDCRSADAGRHRRDGHACPDAKVAAQDRVAARERDRPTSIGWALSEVLHEGRKGALLCQRYLLRPSGRSRATWMLSPYRVPRNRYFGRTRVDSDSWQLSYMAEARGSVLRSCFGKFPGAS